VGSIFNYDGTGDLEVEVGRGPATISGVVMNGDKPVAGADIAFVRWPTLPIDDRDAVRHIQTGDDGTFRIARIVPSEYRIFAVKPEDRLLAERPAAWQTMMGRATKLMLAPGASENLTVRLEDPKR
jgi:hypothetical protein